MPDVSQTTVYNTLYEWVALGELAPVENLREGGARFDTNTSNHHHLFCMHCHTLVDIERDFPDVQLALAEAKGYQIEKNKLPSMVFARNAGKSKSRCSVRSKSVGSNIRRHLNERRKQVPSNGQS